MELQLPVKHNNLRILFYLFLLFLAVLSNILLQDTLLYAAKIILLNSYLFFEIKEFRKSNSTNWFLSPVVLASILTFALSFGITNIVYFIPNSISHKYIYNILGPEPFPYLNKAMDYIFIAAFFMWLGYRMKSGDKLFNLLTNNSFVRKSFFTRTDILKFKFVWFFLIISIASRIVQIQLGLYGFAGDPESREQYGAVWNILYSIGILGNLVLIVSSTNFFIKGNRRFLFLVSFATELGFGLLSGMKSEIMLPFFIIGFTYYIAKKRFNKILITFAFVSIVIAYIIVEPFRILRMSDKRFSSDPITIVNTIIDSYEINKRAKLVDEQSFDVILLQFLSRLEYTLTTARAIQYKDQVGLDTRAQDFRERLLTIPLQAYIPRAIWSDKPLEDSGKWYSVNVWGGTENTSVAYSPIGFAYFAGGIIPLIIVFILIGILQKTLFNFLKLGNGGMIVYFGLLLSVVLIDSKVNTIFVAWLRTLPFLYIIQSLFYKK